MLNSSVQTYFMCFGMRRPHPLPYTRSLIQALFLRGMKVLGRLTVESLLFDDLKELCNPVKELLDPANTDAEAPQSPAFQIAQRMDWFVEKAGRVCSPPWLPPICHRQAH